MNKNKIIMSAIGGVALVATLVIGYLAYDSYSEQMERADDLDSAKANVQRINSAKVAPEQASIDAINQNKAVLAAWRDEAYALASHGDARVESGVTAEAFKQTMVADARELSKLPGGANGVIVKEGFGFGFKDIITGGSMPEAAKLAQLQRQWSEVKRLVEMLSSCGVTELLDVAVVEKAAAPEPEVRRGARNQKKVEVKKPAFTDQSYELKFMARPAAFVRLLNALATDNRFMTVDDFSFARASDALVAVLGGGKENAEATSGRRGRRGRRGSDEAAEENKDGEVTKKGLVIDPASAVPFTVTLKLTTFDFGSKANGSDEKVETKEEEE